MRFFTLATVALFLTALSGCANREPTSVTSSSPASADLTPMEEPVAPEAAPEPEPEPEPEPDPEPELVVDIEFVAPEAVEGWTEFVRLPTTEIVFVSSSEGNDNNDGSLPETPVRSLSRARSIMESLDPSNSGTGNWMVLRRGDTWNENFGTWRRSGVSSNERLLIGTYGPGSDPRPRVRSGSRDGFHVGPGVRHLALVGIHLEAEGNAAFAATSPDLFDILVEDCVMTNSNIGFQAQGGSDGIKLRRSQVVHNSVLGMFTQDTHNILIEENIVDDNGTSLTHNHNMYISHPGSNIVIRNNIITRAANHGLKFRGPHVNGVIEGNVFAGNRNPVIIHCKDEGEQNVNVSFRNNVMVEIGHDGQHCPLRITSTRDLVVENNIMAHAADFRAQAAVQFAQPRHIDENPNGNWPPIENLVMRQNVIYNINGLGLHFQDSHGGRAVELRNVRIEDNVISVPDSDSPRAIVRCDSPVESGLSFQGNAYDVPNSPNQWFEIDGSWLSIDSWLQRADDAEASVGTPSFTDANRTVSRYHGTLGGTATLAAFLNEASRQSKYTWRLEYTAESVAEYIREGFDMN